MEKQPLVLGINRTQDASACLMEGSTMLWAIQKERLTRHKHHWGKTGDVGGIYLPRLPGLDREIDVLVECYSSDAEFGSLARYEQELSQSLRLAPEVLRGGAIIDVPQSPLRMKWKGARNRRKTSMYYPGRRA